MTSKRWLVAPSTFKPLFVSLRTAAVSALEQPPAETHAPETMATVGVAARTKNRLLALVTLASLIGFVVPAAGQQQITPPAPIPVTSLGVTVNNSPGDQTDPHVSGNIATYTSGSVSERSIRYFNFATNVDQAIPKPAGATDFLPDVSGARISLTRVVPDRVAIMVFDTSNGSTIEVAPQAGSQRIGAAIGNTTVAYIDFSSGAGVTFALDLAGGGAVQLSSGPGTSQNPNVAPTGHTVVWEQCVSSVIHCDVMAAVFKTEVQQWSVFAVAAEPGPEANPDTDGAWIAYDANRAGSATGGDIYFKPIIGDGIERQLAIAGVQSNPSISQGVIAFENRTVLGAAGDIFVYVIASNTLYQVTSTPLTDEILADVSVLPNGDIRVVWAANDGLQADYNVYATTFTPQVDASQQLSDLIALVQSFNLQQGIENSLDAKLNNAQAALDAAHSGDLGAACGLLGAFVNEVESQTGQKITATQADQLIGAALQIMATLGCP